MCKKLLENFKMFYNFNKFITNIIKFFKINYKIDLFI